MSAISSSDRTILFPESGEGPSTAGALADALPAIAKESPAAPHTCRAFFDLFRLELCLACAIGKTSSPYDLDENPSYPARFLTIRGEPAGYFIGRAHNRQPLAYLSFEDQPGRRSAAHLLTRDEARRIAATSRSCPSC
jgi:hypothetical protein